MRRSKKNRTYDTRDGELPVVKWEVHNCLGVAALTATTPVRSEAVEHALGHVDAPRGHCCGRRRRKTCKCTKAEVARALTIYGGRLFLDVFRDELEELLRILVLT